MAIDFCFIDVSRYVKLLEVLKRRIANATDCKVLRSATKGRPFGKARRFEVDAIRSRGKNVKDRNTRIFRS